MATKLYPLVFSKEESRFSSIQVSPWLLQHSSTGLQVGSNRSGACARRCSPEVGNGENGLITDMIIDLVKNLNGLCCFRMTPAQLKSLPVQFHYQELSRFLTVQAIYQYLLNIFINGFSFHKWPWDYYYP